jgi:thiosulfate dehydrogenase [quinone] large subunit
MAAPLSRAQAVALVVLRTLIGWHFLYEGWFKLAVPGWSRAGAPLAAWSAAGYLAAATGPFAAPFHALAQSSLLHVVNGAIPIALVVTGLLLMLGLFTQIGAALGLLLLVTFYLAAIPLAGIPVPGAEGSYLIVNKTLVEAAALAAVFAFRTGRIAGLDLLIGRRGRQAAAAPEPAAPVPADA